MPPTTQSATRRLFLASLVLFAFSLVFSVANVVTVFSAPLRAVSVPTGVGYEGYLTDAFGAPLAGSHNLTFKLYSAATGGAALWTQTHTAVPVTGGLYSVLLTGLPVSGFTGDRWLGVTVGAGTEIAPRTRIASVPFALNAQQAEEVAWTGLTGVPAGFSDGVDNTTGGIGGGAAGRVAVYDSASSISGAAGLLHANNTLTVTGHLHTTGSIQQSTSLGARVYNSAALSIPGTNTQTVLTFDSERWDSDNIHSTTTNTSRLTVTTPGTYLILGNIEYAAHATGSRGALIRLNGLTFIASQRLATAPGSVLPKIQVSTVYNLVAGDYVELLAVQDSGASLNVTTVGNHTPEFMLVRLP